MKTKQLSTSAFNSEPLKWVHSFFCIKCWAVFWHYFFLTLVTSKVITDFTIRMLESLHKFKPECYNYCRWFDQMFFTKFFFWKTAYETRLQENFLINFLLFLPNLKLNFHNPVITLQERLKNFEKGQYNDRNYSFWQNISISIFKFSPFLYTLKAWQWNLINFSKFANALIRKEKKHLYSCQQEKKSWTLFYNRLFYKVH